MKYAIYKHERSGRLLPVIFGDEVYYTEVEIDAHDRVSAGVVEIGYNSDKEPMVVLKPDPVYSWIRPEEGDEDLIRSIFAGLKVLDALKPESTPGKIIPMPKIRRLHRKLNLPRS